MTSTHTLSPGRCLGTTAQGHPCRAWAQKEGDYCFAHRFQTGARAGDHYPDPSRRELETFNNLVDDMFKRFSILAAMLDGTDVGTDRYFKMMNVYGHFVTHLAGVLRVGRSLGESPDDVLEMLGQAAQELAEEQGWAAFADLTRY